MRLDRRSGTEFFVFTSSLFSLKVNSTHSNLSSVRPRPGLRPEAYTDYRIGTPFACRRRSRVPPPLHPVSPQDDYRRPLPRALLTRLYVVLSGPDLSVSFGSVPFSPVPLSLYGLSEDGFGDARVW